MLETMRLLQLYADLLLGLYLPTPTAQPAEDAEEHSEDDGEAEADGGHDSVASAPSANASAVDEATPPTVRVLPRGRFSLVSMGGVEGLAFIASNDGRVDPTVVCAAVFRSIAASQLLCPLSPHLYRLIPVLYTASAASLATIVPPPSVELLPPGLTQPFTFAVQFRHSNCSQSSVDRAGVIAVLGGRVEEEAKKRSLACSVDLKHCDLAVLCWLVKSVACVAVMGAYHRCNGYNVMEMTKAMQGTPQRAVTPEPVVPSAELV